ncbi:MULTISPECIES: toll/interleukin-1 receptor domain-containing protein [unclassified Sinorhizobium]|uniref:toll/interleukin-1 receptor domain-containing protein n=1 Tax=unclassified Sinorhizobium TaxID=2613772 RepID=UPI0024C27212|nr:MULTISPECIES: toll/interleukin-1 receptor domain-containing protein [unclassified Sinorhizobium]MDK1376580.1 toll/interleukin-1 receptor domain-containing protein [Sinorhizobium sp. 6-70]MDK1481222.1 toll/interleukin-1 receptor domain-containing protein [Sinorhizobium sp. 6-117]
MQRPLSSIIGESGALGQSDRHRNASPYKYSAFVSYSSSDRAIAEKLQKSLESFRIPKALRRSGEHPNGRLSPIFRDRSDLKAAVDLGAVIRDALQDSEYLIVLCSPAAAASPWVIREISYFQGLDRPNNIIAVIVSGFPAVYDPLSAPLGAFPRELISIDDGDGSVVEPLAADIQEPGVDRRGGDGFNLAKLKIIATMLRVSLAELTQRQAEVDRRQRRIAQVVATAMVFLAAFASIGAYIAWDQSVVAEARLQTAVETAARQIGATIVYRDRYGVPADVIRDLLNSAERDFGKLVSNEETSPTLVYQRVRLNLEFAELFNLVGDGHSQQKLVSLIAESATAVTWLENRRQSITEWIGLSSVPEPSAIAVMRLKLYDAQAKEHSYAGKYREAISLAEAGVMLSQNWLSKTGELHWLREVAQGHCRIGLFNYQLANLSASAAAYQKCLENLRSLITRRQDVSDRADLMTVLSELATTLVEMDRRPEALALQREAVDTAKSLVAAERGNTEYERTQMITLARLGDMITAVEMDVAASAKLYKEALVISDRLTKSDASRLDWQRDRSLLLERLASAQLRAADGAQAATKSDSLRQADTHAYQALEIVSRLLDRDPLNLAWRRDLTVLEERLGQIAFADYKQTGHLPRLRDSERWYDKAVGERRGILAGDPMSTIYQLDLAIALIQLGEVAIEVPALNDKAEAVLKEALQLLETLTKGDHAPTIWLREIAKTRSALANLYERKGRISDARSEIQAALDGIHHLREKHPNNLQYREDEADLTARKIELIRTPK